MTKKEFCNCPSIAYYSGFGGFEIKHIMYSFHDVVYAVSGAWTAHKSYHRLKIRYTAKGSPYVILHGCRIPLDECIRMN